MGLSVVKLHEELSGEGSVFTDSSGGRGSMMGGCWGVVEGVGVFRHALFVEDAEGVPAKGGMSLPVFKGLDLLLVPSVPRLLLGGWRLKGVVV